MSAADGAADLNRARLDDGASFARRPVFGPVPAITPSGDFDDAGRLVHDTTFGLAAVRYQW